VALTDSAAHAALSGYDLPEPQLQPLAGGHINAAWRVTTSRGASFFLQRLNSEVFRDGEAVMRNLTQVTAHLGRAVRHLPDHHRRALRLQARRDGTVAWRDPHGAWWRMFHFIERATGGARSASPRDAHEVGRAFGQFHEMLRDYDGPALDETIPRFHDTALRLSALDGAAARDVAGRATSAARDLAFADERRGYAQVVPALIASGALPLQIVHNDAKAENVLLDEATGEALAVVDLDTVMPGTVLYDVGDLIRSTASLSDEDERDLDRIAVQPSLIAALASGFFGACGRSLNEAECRHFVFAGLLLTYEQGVRFLTDHIAGDRYYRISRPGQNLDRARAQFRLLEHLESCRSQLGAMIDRIVRERAG
jgi:Ser/Thr protein kinase RdoA (MazF antagonist)